jgi:hypothetical protein
VGGLVSRDTNDSRNSVPGARDIPGLGWLFKDFNKSDNTQELIIVVNPVVLREPVSKPGRGPTRTRKNFCRPWRCPGSSGRPYGKTGFAGTAARPASQI